MRVNNHNYSTQTETSFFFAYTVITILASPAVCKTFCAGKFSNTYNISSQTAIRLPLMLNLPENISK